MPAAGEVAGASPEKQIDDALRGSAAVNVGQLQDLVAAMRSRDTLPIPSLGDGADAGVAFANAEADTNTREVRLAADTSPGGTMTLALTNLDAIPRDVVVRELRDRSSVAALGAVELGRVHDRRPDDGPPAGEHVGAADGDREAGRGRVLALDRRPERRRPGRHRDRARPRPAAPEPRDRPRAGQAAPRGARPGGQHVGHARQQRPGRPPAPERHDDQLPGPRALLAPRAAPRRRSATRRRRCRSSGPGDVAVDKHGIVWITLTTGERDRAHRPKVATPGSFNGIKVFDLEAVHRRDLPPAARARSARAAPLTRLPLQMKVRDDGSGRHRPLLHRAERRRHRRAPRLAERRRRSPSCTSLASASSHWASRSIPTATSGTARARATASAG